MPWAPPADRFTVLAAALEQDEPDLPALDVLRAELARTGQRRQAGHAAARLAAQDLRTALPDLAAARTRPAPGHGQPSRQPRRIERDEPEAEL